MNDMFQLLKLENTASYEGYRQISLEKKDGTDLNVRTL